MMCMMGVVVIFMYLVVKFKHDCDLFMNYFNLMCDNISHMMVILSVWVMLMILLSIISCNMSDSFFLKVIVITLMISLMGVFFSTDYIMFYIMFELSLVVTFVLILGYGYQPERMQAGMYMVLYTMFGSLPLLLVFIYMKLIFGGNMMMVSLMVSESFISVLMIVFSLIAFLVKLPVFILHLWLPKAHVEAPVMGSMILAAVLLKLGGYGIVRVLLVVSNMSSWLMNMMSMWCILGGVVLSVMCLRQYDIKLLIALSSVVHMSILVGGLLTQNSWGINGSINIMLGHGFCSSAMFYISNVCYSRVNSRNMNIMKGVYSIVPSLSMFWFLLVMGNMSAPPSLSLFGEIMVIISLVNWSMIYMILLGMMVFFVGAYSLLMFMLSQHGKSSVLGSSYFMMNNCEMNVCVMHLIPLYLFFFICSDIQFF
uniref:NADH dehydrogenase subunit 4 n=1 Tax=Tachaea chinensis TaxID=1862870 RepID=UPI000EF2DF92|nr:NADH dehydrogenase subunit 4 [Tachaea chinensis]ATO58516.1 NADH dehydrogenase subunit 4 [Tachaea chinensis]